MITNINKYAWHFVVRCRDVLGHLECIRVRFYGVGVGPRQHKLSSTKISLLSSREVDGSFESSYFISVGSRCYSRLGGRSSIDWLIKSE